MASITGIAARIKDQGAGFITEELVHQACVAADHRWRERLLGPVETLQPFVLQVLGGNIACRAVTLLAGRGFTPQAYCNARMRLSEAEYALLPDTLVVRELRYTLARRGFRTQTVTLVTTLVDAARYPKHELVELYGARWSIETNLRHLKQTMGMNVLHCTTREGVLKELWIHLIVYNRVRLAMLNAARRQGVPPDRISFIDALDMLRCCPRAAPTLTPIVNPRRPGRHEPRVIKRRKDCYTYMTMPRDQLRQALGITRHAA